MLAKLTAKNQLTLPVELLRRLPRSQYFDAAVEGGAIVLRPVQVVAALDLEKLRDEVAALGASEADVGAAVRRARRGRKK
jgi:hypothetical protein